MRLEITNSGRGNKSVVLNPSLALTRYRYSRTESKPKTVHGNEGTDVTQPRDGKSVYTDFATERIAFRRTMDSERRRSEKWVSDYVIGCLMYTVRRLMKN